MRRQRRTGLLDDRARTLEHVGRAQHGGQRQERRAVRTEDEDGADVAGPRATPAEDSEAHELPEAQHHDMADGELKSDAA